MKTLVFVLAFGFNHSFDPGKPVGGGCDGCKAMYAGMPRSFSSTDTSAGWATARQKLLITGRVLQRDGRKPAPGIVLYYWHTDERGYYTPRPGQPEDARKHGYLRGWVKTDAAGRYAIYTSRPAPYPGEQMPAHIHVVVKEPHLNEYWIDDWVFDDDPLLTTAERKKMVGRGGSGVLRVLKDKNVQVAIDDIVLGLNIPHHPARLTGRAGLSSGLEIGEDQSSFEPTHVWGPDKGTRTCPVCKYGRYFGIIFFIGPTTNTVTLRKWLTFFERQSVTRGSRLKVYVVGQQQQASELKRLGEEGRLTKVALTYVPAFADVSSDAYLNKINAGAESTLVMYRNRTIVEKFVNLPFTASSLQVIERVLDGSARERFELPLVAGH